MPRAQEATTTTTFTKKYKIILFFIAIGALIAFNAPMASLFIDQPTELQNLPIALKQQKKERFFIVKSLTNLTEKFNKGDISKEVFTQKSKEIVSQFNVKHSEIVTTSKKLKNVKSESEVFRFKSLKIFVSQLGLVLSLLVCSFIILTLAIVYVDDKLVRIISYFTGGLIMIPAIFYSLWVFTTESDLSKGKYIFTFVSISLGVSIAMFFVYKFLLQIFVERISLKQRIATLLNLVSSIRYDHFFKLAKKSIQRKLTVEEVTKEADILDEKIYTNYEKII